MTHLGNNIERIRGFQRLSQKQVAADAGLSQQEYSKLVQHALIDEDVLEKIANALKVPVDVVKELNANAITNNFYHSTGAQGHIQTVYTDQKAHELYERMLAEKDKRIETLERELELARKK